MLVPLLATDIFLSVLACTAFGFLIVTLAKRQNAHDSGMDIGQSERAQQAEPVHSPSPNDRSDDETWLLRLKAACEAGYYKTESDCERQTPLPGRGSQTRGNEPWSGIRRRVRHAWRASYALAASPFSAHDYADSPAAESDEFDAARQRLRPRGRQSFGGGRDTEVR